RVPSHCPTQRSSHNARGRAELRSGRSKPNDAGMLLDSVRAGLETVGTEPGSARFTIFWLLRAGRLCRPPECHTSRRAAVPVPSAHACEALRGLAVTDTPAVRPVVLADSPHGRGRRSTRAMLAAAADAQASAEELAAIVRSARADVVEAFETAREPQVWTAIEKRSIEAVKDIVD